MLPALLATVIVLIMVALLNLALTMGVIRQLRSHAEVINAGRHQAAPGVIGSRVDDFSVATDHGDVVRRDRLGAYTLVAFFLPGCPGCEVQLPEFLRYVADGGPRGSDVVVVVGGSDGREDVVAQLGPSVAVVSSDGTSEMVEAFDNSLFPAFYLIDRDGAVLQSSSDIRSIAPPRVPTEVR